MNDREFLAVVRAMPSPTRAETRRWAWAMGALAALTSLAVFAWAGGVRATGRPTLMMGTTAAGAAGVALVATGLGAFRGRSMLGRPRALLLGIAVAVPLLLLAWKLAVTAGFD